MKTFAFVFARGGSKGVPYKNIKKLIDKPLIGHTLEIVNKLPEIEHCFVSTDCPEIARVSKNFKSIVIDRPSVLAQDDSNEWMAWRHAIEWTRNKFGDFDRFVSLPTTAPLRILSDVRRCLDALDKNTDAVITITPSQRTPWFNMVKFNKEKEGYMNLVIENSDKITRRQDAPAVFDMTTVSYVLRPDFIMKKENIWEGRVRGIIIPQERAIDIDTEFDFKIVEFIMSQRVRSSS